MAKSWRNVFLLALALFLLSRALLLNAFPIFNDEALYLQYSQLIHADWAKNKFVSMRGEFGDWKPPLQYWLAAPLIRAGGDPLFAGRSVALLVSLAGFLGVYLFARELFSEREGTIASLLYVLCPTVAFHNDQFIAETFLFSTAPLLYWALLKATRPNERRGIWMLPALIFATALLLFKQSGALLLMVSIFLPLARLRRLDPSDAGESNARNASEFAWKEFAINLGIVALVIACAYLIAGVILPADHNDIRKHFDHRWVMTARELTAIPTGEWAANLRLVADYITAYFSWLVPLFVALFLWLTMRRKSLPDLALAAMFASGASAICFLLHGFNEYLFNTAIVVVLLPILARSGLYIWDFARCGWDSLGRGALLALAGLTIVFWGYQIVLMTISPGRYLERSTPWAQTHYLCGWPTGFGVKEIVALLEKEKRPGIIFADAQWGNPRTALEVYGLDRFPNLRIIPALQRFPGSGGLFNFIEEGKKRAPARFAIFSADPVGPRKLWQAEVESAYCSDRIEIKAYPGQMPIIVCRF